MQDSKWNLEWPHPLIMSNVIDSPFSEQFNKVGIGLCLRDEFGMFMGANAL
jgi:hypothetical protein